MHGFQGVVIGLVLVFGAGVAGTCVLGLLLCGLPDWWQYRPMTRRRALKIARKEIDERCDVALSDMQAAAEGRTITRGGMW